MVDDRARHTVNPSLARFREATGAPDEIETSNGDEILHICAPAFARVGPLGMAIVGLILAVLVLGAVLAPAVSPEDYRSFRATASNLPPRLTGPGSTDWRYVLGTDAEGHSILMWVAYGGRLSLFFALLSSLLACTIAFLLTRIVRVHSVLRQGASIVRSLPLLLLGSILLRDAGPEHTWAMVPLFAAAAWPSHMSVVQMSPVRRHWREILGRVFLVAAPVLLLQATIDFLGFGVQPPEQSWGRALFHASDYMAAGNWWWIVFPGVALACASVSFHCLGRCLGR